MLQHKAKPVSGRCPSSNLSACQHNHLRRIGVRLLNTRLCFVQALRQPKRLCSWHTKVDSNPRRYRCGCSSGRPPAESSSHDSDTDGSKNSTPEPKQSPSGSQDPDNAHAEVREVLKKAIRGAPGGSARQKLPLQYIWKKDLKKLGQALPL